MMAKRKGSASTRKTAGGRKSNPARRSVKRPKAKAPRRPSPSAKGKRKAAPKTKAKTKRVAQPARTPARKRARTTPGPTPPSSLDLRRRGSAARTGREEIAEHREEQASMTPAITGGDVDASVQSAYFSGDDAPGGDHANPDQDVVEEIGLALGVRYEDAEELKSTDKIVERDRHRWELDPASSEDYEERGKRRKEEGRRKK